MQENGIEAFIKYNYFHKEQRPRYTPNPFHAESLHYNEEAKQENSNKNPVVNSTQRDYMSRRAAIPIRVSIQLPRAAATMSVGEMYSPCLLYTSIPNSHFIVQRRSCRVFGAPIFVAGNFYAGEIVCECGQIRPCNRK